MKKFLKILLIIIGIVFLIFAALICIGLFVDYDDHIENGRYTYVPEDDNKDNAYVEFNLSDYDKKDSELIYYSSVEEAILNSPLNTENEEFSVPEDFLNHVDEILHIWNGKQYDTIFYRAGSDNDPVQGFVMARCKKQVEEATVQYAFMNATPVTTKADSILMIFVDVGLLALTSYIQFRAIPAIQNITISDYGTEITIVALGICAYIIVIGIWAAMRGFKNCKNDGTKQ